MLSEPRIGVIAQMGCDAPPLCPGRCLYRGLRVLSEPRITLIAQMGCDAPRPFVPMVVCIGDSWDFGWEFGDFGLIGGG